MKSQTCQFCDTIVYGEIRCDKCNIVWNNGVKFGRNSSAFELKNILDNLTKLTEDTK